MLLRWCVYQVELTLIIEFAHGRDQVVFRFAQRRMLLWALRLRMGRHARRQLRFVDLRLLVLMTWGHVVIVN